MNSTKSTTTRSRNSNQSSSSSSSFKQTSSSLSSTFRSTPILSSPNLNFGRYFSRNRRRRVLFRSNPNQYYDEDDDDDDVDDDDVNNNKHIKSKDSNSSKHNSKKNDNIQQRRISRTNNKNKKKNNNKNNYLPMNIDQLMYTDEQNYLGWYSPWFFIIWCIFLIVPAAYIYIGLVVLRELCRQFPNTIYTFILYYTPYLANVIDHMKHVSWFVEIWCYIEAIFYISLKLQIKFLNSYDPLETSLAAAPLMSNEQRATLWNNMLLFEQNKIVPFISGWFFDSSIYHISKYDIRDFISWSMYEGRHLEHLTLSELNQLESFVKDLEELITIELYNTNNNNTIAKNDDTENNHQNMNESIDTTETEKTIESHYHDASGVVDDSKVHNTLLDDDEIFQDTNQSEPDVLHGHKENDDHITTSTMIDYHTPTKNSSSNSFTTIKNNDDSNSHYLGKLLLQQDKLSNVDFDDDDMRTENHGLFRVDSKGTQISELLVKVDNNNTMEDVETDDDTGDDYPSTGHSSSFVTKNNNNNTIHEIQNNNVMFRFREEIQHEEPSFFSDFLESYRNAFMTVQHLHPSMDNLRNMVTNVTSVQELRNMVNHAANEMGELVHTAVAPARNMVNHAANEMGDLMYSVTPVQELRNMVSHAANEMSSREFHPVQEIRNFMVGTAGATASHMYETFIPSGSVMDKRLTAVSHATYTQLIDAWNSVKNIRERLEMAHFVSKQRKHLRQQLKGYRAMLNQMREMSFAVPSKQMAQMMNRITDCNERMELLESKARAAFVSATGFTLKNIPGFGKHHEPQRYAKYSSDPLLGLATYPLGFHLTVLGFTELPLRFILMKKRGFERTSIGPVTYYYHPGIDSMKTKRNTMNDDGGESIDDIDDDLLSTGSSSKGSSMDNDFDDDRPLPLVFIHGIGLGLLPYMQLIDALLKLGRPLFLPEIPFVSGFRPWQSPNCVLQPAVVTSTMTAMLATHGYLRAHWLGHSYGTTWLSYMCQLAESAVASLMFLDPICFGLHIPCLAKQFVYSRPDPGTISYIVRTDVIVKWTIQRSFPWAWIVLFLEQIGNRPCHIFLSENDALVPAKRIKQYLEDNGVPITAYCTKQNKKIDINNIETYDYDESDQQQELSNVEKNDNLQTVASDGTSNQDHDNDDIVSDDDITVRHNNDSHHHTNNNDEVKKSTNTSIGIDQNHNHHNIRCTHFLGDGHGDWTERRTPVFESIVHVAYELCLQVEANDRRQIREANAAAASVATTNNNNNHNSAASVGKLITNIPSDLR